MKTQRKSAESSIPTAHVRPMRVEVVHRYGSMRAVRQILCTMSSKVELDKRTGESHLIAGHSWRCRRLDGKPDVCMRCEMEDPCEHPPADPSRLPRGRS